MPMPLPTEIFALLVQDRVPASVFISLLADFHVPMGLRTSVFFFFNQKISSPEHTDRGQRHLCPWKKM